MKNIYTYGGKPARRNLTMACIQTNKASGHKMVQVDAATEEEAALLERMGVDLITIADSDIDVVRAGAPDTFLTCGQTMVQYVTEDEALGAAIRCAERGADAIYTPRGLKTVERLAQEGLCVQGHLGLVPRLSTRVGGCAFWAKPPKKPCRSSRVLNALKTQVLLLRRSNVLRPKCLRRSVRAARSSPIPSEQDRVGTSYSLSCKTYAVTSKTHHAMPKPGLICARCESCWRLSAKRGLPGFATRCGPGLSRMRHIRFPCLKVNGTSCATLLRDGSPTAECQTHS